MKQKFLPSFLKNSIVFFSMIIGFIEVDAQTTVNPATTPTPELVFQNPVLKSGTLYKEGSVYRFSGVTSGVDAEVKLKKLSRSDIYMVDIDLPGLGWEKAFQPNFGLQGTVPPYQNWYIDFEVTFFKSGTNTKQKMARFDLTSLDVDGDGVSISEYITMFNPTSTNFSTVSYLTGGGTGTQCFTCPDCGSTSPVVQCDQCSGTGRTNSGSGTNNPCDACNGSGKVFQACDHPAPLETLVQGPVVNFVNIDTAATQVMATYTYQNLDRFSFRVGAKSGSVASSAGVRLNSMWYRSFSLAPTGGFMLPVKLIDFGAKYDKNKVNLNWTTAQEKQFNHFVVERSNDGKNYSDINVVFTSGSSDSKKDYALTDANLSDRGGLLYYRLKMVDADKQTTYSPVRIIRLGEEKPTLSLTSYPNPVVNDLRVTIPATWQGKEVRFEIVNGNGQSMKIQKTRNASQTEVIPVADLGRGIYFIKASTDKESAQQRIIKN